MKIIKRSLASALLLTVASAHVALADDTKVKAALAPIKATLNTLVLIGIGIGVTICVIMLIFGGVEKILAGSNVAAETQAQRRIANAIIGLVVIGSASTIAYLIVAILSANGVIPPDAGL
jgi:Type IV secretion system pilin